MVVPVSLDSKEERVKPDMEGWVNAVTLAIMDFPVKRDYLDILVRKLPYLFAELF